MKKIILIMEKIIKEIKIISKKFNIIMLIRNLPSKLLLLNKIKRNLKSINYKSSMKNNQNNQKDYEKIKLYKKIQN